MASDPKPPTDPGTAPPGASSGPTNDGAYTLQWLAAWVVFLMIASLINRTRLGHAVIYHLLVIAVVVLLAGQYRRFAQLEEPISGVIVQ